MGIFRLFGLICAGAPTNECILSGRHAGFNDKNTIIRIILPMPLRKFDLPCFSDGSSMIDLGEVIRSINWDWIRVSPPSQ